MYAHVKPADWHVFEKSFPQAAAFLCAADLKGEYAHLSLLNSKNQCNEWQLNRLKELAEHFSNQ
jgi:hypothetical protein